MSHREEASGKTQRTRWRDYVSRLAWERPRVPPEELEEVSGVREVWASLLRLLPPCDPVPDQALVSELQPKRSPFPPQRPLPLSPARGASPTVSPARIPVSKPSPGLLVMMPPAVGPKPVGKVSAIPPLRALRIGPRSFSLNNPKQFLDNLRVLYQTYGLGSFEQYEGNFHKFFDQEFNGFYVEYAPTTWLKFADDTTLVGLITKGDETHYRKEGAAADQMVQRQQPPAKRQQDQRDCCQLPERPHPTPPTDHRQVLQWKGASAPPPIMTTFYRGTIESILTSCITVWGGSYTVHNRKAPTTHPVIYCFCLFLTHQLIGNTIIDGNGCRSTRASWQHISAVWSRSLSLVPVQPPPAAGARTLDRQRSYSTEYSNTLQSKSFWQYGIVVTVFLSSIADRLLPFAPSQSVAGAARSSSDLSHLLTDGLQVHCRWRYMMLARFLFWGGQVNQHLDGLGQPSQPLILCDELGGTQGILGGEKERSEQVQLCRAVM
ncbi:hypothetical protein L3Q82_017089 [Scortum barcoo]|uniref:Uncharacterized protein n=1 Tax=Scortum barcoo TaxID=214431 RepID=A0ACB8X9G2_9TELE|nr:hypothetical protein L3Q82_017089 [Scortum barcoo]